MKRAESVNYKEPLFAEELSDLRGIGITKYSSFGIGEDLTAKAGRQSSSSPRGGEKVKERSEMEGGGGGKTASTKFEFSLFFFAAAVCVCARARVPGKLNSRFNFRDEYRDTRDIRS